MDLNELLSADELETYRRHMEAIAQDSNVSVTAAEMVRRMLRLLVTNSGKANETEGLHFGRETVLPLLIEALVGSDPDPTAWIEAIAKGSFDLTGYKAYGAPNATMGSPGNYLPRLLKRYEKAAGRPGPMARQQAADLRTALGILIATTLLRELKNATNARAALGSAWPLVESVNARKYAELRKLIAQFGSEERFQAHIASSIEAAVRKWVEKHGSGRLPLRNDDVNRHVKDPERIKTFFVRQKDAAARREEALVEFGRLIIAGGTVSDDDASARALSRIQKDPAYESLSIAQADTLAPLVEYLSNKEPVRASEFHHQLLRQLMPIAAGPSTHEQITGCALRAASFLFPECQFVVSGIARLDRPIDRITRAIFDYACEVGPPPPAVALAHLPWFEASVCFHAVSNYFPARSKWKAAGLLPCDEDATLFNTITNQVACIAAWTTLADPDVDKISSSFGC